MKAFGIFLSLEQLKIHSHITSRLKNREGGESRDISNKILNVLRKCLARRVLKKERDVIYVQTP